MIETPLPPQPQQLSRRGLFRTITGIPSQYDSRILNRSRSYYEAQPAHQLTAVELYPAKTLHTLFHDELRRFEHKIKELLYPPIKSNALVIAAGALAAKNAPKAIEPTKSSETVGIFDFVDRFAWEQKQKTHNVSRRRVLGVGAAIVTLWGADRITQGFISNTVGGWLKPVTDKLSVLENLRKIEVEPVAYDPDKIFIAKPHPTAIPPVAKTEGPPQVQPEKAISHVVTTTPKPPISPTPEPTKTIKEQIGTKNAAEFLLERLVNMLNEQRKRKYATDPSYRDRIPKEALNQKTINLLLLGLDQTHGSNEFIDFGHFGFGRSDVIKIVSFDPSTFRLTIISIPRDVYAPEVIHTHSNVNRANVAPMQPVIETYAANTNLNRLSEKEVADRQSSNYALLRKIAESATGLPIDMVLKFNFDIVAGYQEGDKTVNGIIGDLFPEGLEIDVPSEILDTTWQIPVNEGGKKLADGKSYLHFPAGKQTMNPKQLLRYARTRETTSDYDRAARQTQVITTALKNLIPAVLGDLGNGNTLTIDRMINSLESQKKHANLFFDEVDIIEIVKAIRNGIHEKFLSDTVNGLANASVLLANSTEKLNNFIGNAKKALTSYGLVGNGADQLIENVDAPQYGAMTKLKEGKVPSEPNNFGNFLAYWEPLRDKVKTLLT